MKKGLKLLLCVDWEGLSLQQENLLALQAFKKRWAIPLLHFLNPAYFTSRSLRNSAIGLDFSPLFSDQDWVGLHLHGTRNFVETCGLSFRDGPTFAQDGDQNPREFQGHEVMLHTYSPTEFSKMLETSLQIFSDHKWPRPRAFRAGGWMAHPEFLPVLQQWGFSVDSSVAPPSVLQGSSWEGQPLHKYLSLLWGDFNHRSQPRRVDGIWQVPNNFGAIDYWQNGQSFAPIAEALQMASEECPWVVITLHQETAAEHLWKLDEFLQKVQFLNKIKLISSFFESA